MSGLKYFKKQFEYYDVICLSVRVVNLRLPVPRYLVVLNFILCLETL